MDNPLTKWNCDVCGEKIEDAKEGYVIWKTKELKSHSFKIIHKTKCDLDKKHYMSSTALENFLGENGLVCLLSKLSIGPIKKHIGEGSHCSAADIDEFVDFIRRVQTLFYEEARCNFGNPDLLEDYSDANEISPYLPDRLEKIVKKYGENR